MHLPQTFVLLGLLTVAVFVLRLRWWRLPSWLRGLILVAAVAMLLLRIGFIGSQWGFTSTRLNALLAWFSVAGYLVLLARFSLMRPQWITSIGSVILLFPLVGSTLLIPLTRVFDWSAADIIDLEAPYILERSPWDTDSSGNSGMDLIVFYRPPLFPLVRHMVQRAAFSNEECRAAEATAQSNMEQQTVHFHCPALNTSKPAIDLVLPLR